jgi:hypothetical protein
MKSHVSAAVAFAIFAVCAVPASAQGLAALAQKAEDNKKAAEKKKATGKKYTNADAGNVQAATALSQPGSGGSSAKPAQNDGSLGADPAAAGGGDGKDQAYYSGKAKELRAALDRDTVMVSAMQTQINSLTTDFVNRDDPAQRGTIQQDRNRALEELARLQKQIDADKKAISDFEDEARRSNVPPGWLR